MLKKQLDWPLLVKLVCGHSDWQLRVGRGRSHLESRPYVKRLRARENVHSLDGKTVTELASAVADGEDGAIGRRRSVARRHDWNRLADLVAGHFLRGLGPEEEDGTIMPDDLPVRGNTRGAGEAV